MMGIMLIRTEQFTICNMATRRTSLSKCLIISVPNADNRAQICQGMAEIFWCILCIFEGTST